MLSKEKAQNIMSNQGLCVGDAFLLLVANEDATGTSEVNPSLTKEHVWEIMDGALDELKVCHGGSYNMQDSGNTKLIGQNILREFGGE